MMLSQRDDLFPEAFTEEMRGLQDRAARFHRTFRDRSSKRKPVKRSTR